MDSYLRLLSRVIETGKRRPSRAGETVSRFGETLHYTMCNYFPLVTTREINLAPIAGELAAFLAGGTDLKTFEDFGCHYWMPNAEAWRPGMGEVGKIYGYQWRYWNDMHDQIAALLHGLREDPHGRRHLLTAWNPSDLPEMCLPPCHVLAQFYVDSAFLDMAVYMRSVDLCLGMPADMALYGLLLTLIANELKLTPGGVTWFLGDAHVYANHVEQAREQLTRKSRVQPRLELMPDTGIDTFTPKSILLHDYDPHPAIKYKLNI
jgi:thymidylate synthase